jgi:hypothetical protein
VNYGPESRFTAPRDDCPNPEWWTSTDGDSTESEVTELVAAFVRALQPEFCVETGAAWGNTTFAIGEALLRNGHGRLETLEVEPDRIAHVVRRCEGLPVEVLPESSLEYVPLLPVDFAWFDSLCDVRHIEFRRYLPMMHHRTVVGFHDTGPHHAVRAFIEPLVAEGLLAPLLYLPTPRGVAFARVLGGGL